MKQTTTQGSLRPIDADLLSILTARECPLPPEANHGSSDPSEGYSGTAEDFEWALEMRREAADRATERDQADARRYAEATFAVDLDDPKAKAATEFLRKMLEAESAGVAHWTGTDKWSKEAPKWILDPEASPRSNRRPDHASVARRRKFIESDIKRSFRKVRQVSPDSWTACCPAHDDRHPSMTIRRGRTRWLFKCWSHGCSWIEILNAVGRGDIDTRTGEDQ
jgi:hypothetical protein